MILVARQDRIDERHTHLDQRWLLAPAERPKVAVIAALRRCRESTGNGGCGNQCQPRIAAIAQPPRFTRAAHSIFCFLLPVMPDRCPIRRATAAIYHRAA
jgi:hypothetical protein